MPKPLYRVSPRHLSLLKGHISLRASVPVNNKTDCELLSKVIEQQTRQSISVSTLYRIFIHPKPSTPYIHTLDILAQFCGFTHWLDFEEKMNQTKSFDLLIGGAITQNRSVDSLLKICIHDNILTPLQRYFAQYDFPLDPYIGCRLGLDIYHALWDNPNSNIPFFKSCHSLPLIRTYFFEMMADPTFELNGYETGLKLYLSTEKPVRGKPASPSYYFGKSLLFRHYYVSGRYEEAIQAGRKLFQTFDPPLERVYHHAPSIVARHIAYKFWYYELLQNDGKIKKHTIALRELLSTQMNAWSSEEKRIFAYFLADVICLSRSLQHLEILFRSYFSDFLSSLPLPVAEEPLSSMIPMLEIYPLCRYKNGEAIESILLSDSQGVRAMATAH